jgi:hypothetical protein
MNNTQFHNLKTENFFEIGIETYLSDDLILYLLENRHSLDGFMKINQLKLKINKYLMYQTTNEKEKHKIIFEKIEEIREKADRKIIELIENLEKNPNLPFRVKMFNCYYFIYSASWLKCCCDRLMISDYFILAYLKMLVLSIVIAFIFYFIAVTGMLVFIFYFVVVFLVVTKKNGFWNGSTTLKKTIQNCFQIALKKIFTMN